MKITDLEHYRPHVDEFDLTERQKLELVNTIVKIAEMVLDKKFVKCAELTSNKNIK